MAHRALPDKTYLSQGLLSPLREECQHFILLLTSGVLYNLFKKPPSHKSVKESYTDPFFACPYLQTRLFS